MIPDSVMRDIREQQGFIQSGENLPSWRRSAYVMLESELRTKQIIAVMGLRQVGKSTLLKQLAHENWNDFSIWYLPIDFMLDRTPAALNEMIYHFIKNSAKKPLIILDEIQKVDGWADVVKKFYDMQGVKFMLSGSAALKLSKGKESLAGRMIELVLPPLSFPEYLGLNGVDAGEAPERLRELFITYCFSGGLPELALEKKQERMRVLVKSNSIDKIIYEDIPAVFHVRDKQLLYRIFEYACESTANLFDYSKIGAVMGVSKDIVREYLFFLSESFLVHEIPQHAKGFVKRERNLKKIFVCHPSIAMQMLRLDRASLETELAGRFVETAIFCELHSNHSVRFWRDSQKREVDFVVDGSFLVEVKYQNKIQPSDLKNLKTAREEIPGSKAILVTKDLKEEGDGIAFIPAWSFMLESGKWLG